MSARIFLMNHDKQNNAVSEILGTILLLAIAVTAIVVLYYQVFSIPPPNNPLTVTIVGSIQGNTLVFEHQKGESLSLDTKITLRMNIINDTFIVDNYLDTKAREDGEWNIGERVIYPLSYNLQNIQNHFISHLHIADVENNELVFIASLDVYPETDLGITMNAAYDSLAIGSEVNFTICVTNTQGGTPAKDIQILNTLSQNFSYTSNQTSNGWYNQNTGIWTIPSLESGETACLNITTIVTFTLIPTQLAMILDGSGSIDPDDWDIMRTGLANAVYNASTFPHNGIVELTVIQIGGALYQSSWWNNNWDDTPMDWYRSATGHNSSYSAGSRNGDEGSFTSCNLDTSDASSLTIDFWYRLSGTESDDLKLSFYNGASYTYIESLGAHTPNTWLHRTITTTNSQYFRQNFKIQFTSDLAWNEYVYLDDVIIKKDNEVLLNDGFETVYAYAKTILQPTTVWTTNKQSISDQIENMNQIGGYTPIGCGIRLAANQLHEIGAYNTTKRQLICLVTDGVPNCVWVPFLYNGNVMGQNRGNNQNAFTVGKQDAEDARSYLLNKLQMNPNIDEFDALGVGVYGQYGGPDTEWLQNNIVWPQPGNIPPPYIAGWVKTISSYQSFEETIKDIFLNYFGISNNNNVKILSVTPATDPNLANNEVNIILHS